jgi:hypothetical protein
MRFLGRSRGGVGVGGEGKLVRCLRVWIEGVEQSCRSGYLGELRFSYGQCIVLLFAAILSSRVP